MADKWKKIPKDGYSLIINEGGATLGIGPETEKYLIFQDSFAFKDLNRNGILDPYEDWQIGRAHV
jgi:beta-glucosidase